MAEIGTAVAVLQLAGTAVNTCIKLHGVISNIKDSPREILNISSNLQALNTLLSNLQLSLKSPEAQKLVDQDDGVRGAIDNLKGLITCCNNSCIKLQSKLQDEKTTVQEG